MTPMDQSELRQAIRDLYAIDQAGLLNDLGEDLTHELHERPAESLDYCTIGQSLAVNEFADLAVKLFGVQPAAALEAASDALLRTKRRVVFDLLAEYRRRIKGTGSKDWNPLEDFEKYGLDAMLAPPPVRPCDLEQRSEIANVDGPVRTVEKIKAVPVENRRRRA